MDELDLTIIMGSLPEREGLRAQMLESVEAQTLKPATVLYEIDQNHRGVILTYNCLAARVTTEWLFPFADDDLLDPNHFEILSQYMDDAVDVVYTWCRVTGDPGMPETIFQVPIPDNAADQAVFLQNLRYANCIPGSAAIRTKLWEKLGGYRQFGNGMPEDWDFWLRALDAGAQFRCVPMVTWTYRRDLSWQHENMMGN